MARWGVRCLRSRRVLRGGVVTPDEVGQVMYQQTVRVRPRTKFNRPVEEDSWHDPYFQAVSGTMA